MKRALSGPILHPTPGLLYYQFMTAANPLMEHGNIPDMESR